MCHRVTCEILLQQYKRCLLGKGKAFSHEELGEKKLQAIVKKEHTTLSYTTHDMPFLTVRLIHVSVM